MTFPGPTARRDADNRNLALGQRTCSGDTPHPSQEGPFRPLSLFQRQEGCEAVKSQPKSQKQAVLPGAHALVFPPAPADLVTEGPARWGFLSSHRRNSLGAELLGLELQGFLPSLLPSWNSPSAAGRAQNLKPNMPRFTQARPWDWGLYWLLSSTRPHRIRLSSCSSNHLGP